MMPIPIDKTYLGNFFRQYCILWNKVLTVRPQGRIT